LTPLEVLQGKLNDKYVIISHRWETQAHPDPKATKKKVILRFLGQNPLVQGIWIDFSCLPQGIKSGGSKDKTTAEAAFFDKTLTNVNFLYLGGKGLVLLDFTCT